LSWASATPDKRKVGKPSGTVRSEITGTHDRLITSAHVAAALALMRDMPIVAVPPAPGQATFEAIR
jgi:hypothetical protein